MNLKTPNISLIACLLALLGSFISHGYAQDTSLDEIRKLAKPMPFPQPSSQVDTLHDGNMIVIYNLSSGVRQQLPGFLLQGNPSHGLQKGSQGNASDPIEESDSSDSFNDLVPANTLGNLTNYPMRTICKLYMGYNLATSPQWFVCSGTLVGPNVILTAGHCIYNRDNSLGWPDEVRVMPSYEYGPSSSFGTAYGTQYQSYQGWTNAGSWEWDMAFVMLDRSIGLTTGWLGYAYYGDPNEYLNKTIHNFSYPAASPYDGEVMYYQTGTWDYTSGDHLVYSYDPAYGGMSGSSGYWKDANQNRYVLGVLSHGNPSVPTTGFVRFNEQRFHDLQTYIQTVDVAEQVGQSTASFSLFPNPATDVVNLSLSELGVKAKTVTVMNFAGKVFATHAVAPRAKMTIPIGDLAEGLYLIKLQTDRGDFTQKLVVCKN